MHDDTSGLRSVVVRLLGGLSVTCGDRSVEVPPGSRRLLAYVALHPVGVNRRHAAGTLWPTVVEARAAGNLRSALWRLQQVDCDLLRTDNGRIALRPDVVVDVLDTEAWATRILTGTATPADLATAPGAVADTELLPGWYDEWVLAVRDRLRLRLLHALEELGTLLADAGRPREAVEAVQAAVLAEPLRESGQRALIEAHQAAGDWVAARRQFDAFRLLLRREVGVEPSADLAAVATARPAGPPRPRTPTRLTPPAVTPP